MRRAQLHRAHFRRAGAGGGAGGVTSLSFNGGAALTGAIALRSPMLADIGASPVRIDNGNVKTLTDAATIVGIDADLNNAFRVVITAARAFAIPTASIITTPRAGEKITFIIEMSGGSFTPTWTGGAGGYRFANAASTQGVKLTDHNSLAAITPSASYYRIGFEYDATDNMWDAVALAGYWP